MKPTAQRRRDRRDLLDNLLSRALRGRLTTAEAALLAEKVREEQRVSDETRARLADSDRAIVRHRAAADAAIRELEQRAEEAEVEAEQHKADYLNTCATVAAMHAAATGYDDRGPERGVVEDVADIRARMLAAEQRLARIRDMADAWETRLPATIRTATAAEAVRNAAAGDYRPVMFSMSPAPADDDQAMTAPPVPEPYRAPAGDPAAVLDRIRDARRWADVQAQLGMYYGWTAEQSGQRARAYRLDDDQAVTVAPGVAVVNGQPVDADNQRQRADWNASVAATQQRRAEQAEQQLDEQRQALATALRAREDHEWPALIDWAAQAHEWATRAAVKADRKRVEELEHERAVTAAALHDARHQAERYRTAWMACRRDRKADRAAMAADLPAVQAVDRVRALAADMRTWASPHGIASQYADDIERALDGQRWCGHQAGCGCPADLPLIAAGPARRAPEVITDRATIRAALDEPCPDDCPCRTVCLAARP
ncbi:MULTISPECIES: hypothetical protein [Streptomyces rochei group]|uniref:hypothetical protein n=1 Tax=Streptomyces rochei group TaxID=2867164 RepID=UPI0018747997|nr:hypothetical protein [Streptomyces vinaceusdrappus]GHC44374.1 hypothetical protein GCM10010308_74510 [Streptomyces vinaceusdrappus]